MNSFANPPHDPVALVVIVIIVLLIFSSLFVLSLVKAITQRTPGWIIASVLSGAPALFFGACFFVGLALGLGRAATQGKLAANQAGLGQPSQLASAPMTQVSGTILNYQISFPDMNDWRIISTKTPFDFVYAYHDAFIGVSPEGTGMGTPERACEAVRKRLQAKVADYSATDPTPVTIDSRRWLTYDVDATIRGTKIVYRYYVYSDDNYTFQIITWTEPKYFDDYAPVFDRVAQSFKFPQ
jgi:hypothetical protein